MKDADAEAGYSYDSTRQYYLGLEANKQKSRALKKKIDKVSKKNRNLKHK